MMVTALTLSYSLIIPFSPKKRCNYTSMGCTLDVGRDHDRSMAATSALTTVALIIIPHPPHMIAHKNIVTSCDVVRWP